MTISNSNYFLLWSYEISYNTSAQVLSELLEFASIAVLHVIKVVITNPVSGELPCFAWLVRFISNQNIAHLI